ncbi:MAG: MarR family winged helix-turn-helix transcriptional regulator [Jatrophihabitantaceae bacterium]
MTYRPASTDAVARMSQQWRQVLPGLDTQPLLVLGRLQRVVARTDPLLRLKFAAAGLGPGEFDVLAALRREDPAGPVPAGELAETMLVTAGAATKRADRLIAAGLVTRERSGTDGRGRYLALTGRGRELTDRLMTAHMDTEASILSGLGQSEQDQLAHLLSRLLNHLEEPSDHETTGD